MAIAFFGPKTCSETNESTGFVRKYVVLVSAIAILGIAAPLDSSAASSTCSQVSDMVVQLYAKSAAKRAAEEFNMQNLASGGVIQVPLEDQTLIDIIQGVTTIGDVATDERSENIVRCSASAKVTWGSLSMESVEQKHPFYGYILGTAKMLFPSEQRITYDVKPLDDGRLYVTLMPTLY